MCQGIGGLSQALQVRWRKLFDNGVACWGVSRLTHIPDCSELHNLSRSRTLEAYTQSVLILNRYVIDRRWRITTTIL